MQRSIYTDFDANESSSSESDRDFELPQFERREGGTIEYLTPQELAIWRWANVENLDTFLTDVYEYYVGRGFLCIVLSRAVLMATILFVVWFTTYLFSCIDYSKLSTAANLSDLRVNQCIARTSTLHKFALWVFGLLFSLKLLQYTLSMRKLWEIHEFYKYVLQISENEVQAINWDVVVAKIVELKSTNMRSAKYQLDAPAIVNRIMRQENYLIGLYSQNILKFKLKLPLIKHKYTFFSKSLEWSIGICINEYVFNKRGHLRPIIFQENKRDELVAGLERRFQLAAVLSVLLFPVAMVFTTAYYFFRYFNDFKSNPKSLGHRQYTPLAELKFRHFNELLHLFKMRMSYSYEHAEWYISLFPKVKTEILAKFLVFVCSAFAAVLGMLTLYNTEFLQVELYFNKSVLFYLTTLGVLIAAGRASLQSPYMQAQYDPVKAMANVVKYTQYYPPHWQNQLHTEKVKQEFLSLYDLKFKIILREVLGVFLNPIILGVNMVHQSGDIIDYFRVYSTKTEKFGGYVCTLACFGNNIEETRQFSESLGSSSVKMMQSYAQFQQTYPPRHPTPPQHPQHPQATQPTQTNITNQFNDLNNELDDTSASFKADITSASNSDDEDIARDGVLGLVNDFYKR